MVFIVSINFDIGQARNIYFPFEISSDTALEVAREMVKELEITDWNPIEIADMIDEQISALVPSWTKNVYSSDLFNNQYSFDYDDDDDVENNHSLSSHSSSHASLPGLHLLTSFRSSYDHWPAGMHIYIYY